MNYAPNTTVWKPGDLVLHDCDAKRSEMLLRVVKYFDDGKVQAEYVDREKRRDQMRRAKHKDKPESYSWFVLEDLHDPKRFGIGAGDTMSMSDVSIFTDKEFDEIVDAFHRCGEMTPTNIELMVSELSDFRRLRTPTPDAVKLAGEIVATLFTNGHGQKAAAIELIHDDNRFLGRRGEGEVIALIASLIAPHLPRWIPVSERLPERNTVVLVTLKSLRYVTLAMWMGSGWDHDSWHTILPREDVSHWQPMPEPAAADGEVG